MSDLVIRGIPGHHWVRVIVTTRRTCEPGHRWMYRGLVRRDVWRLGPLRFGIIALPKYDEAKRLRRDQGAGA